MKNVGRIAAGWLCWLALHWLVGATGVYAQTDSEISITPPAENPPRYDTSYIEGHRDQLNLTLLGTQKGLALEVVHPENTSRNLVYRPNTSYNWGIGVNYKWVAFELTTRIPLVDYEGPRRGDTRQVGLRAGMTGRRIWLSTFLQYYKGLYLENVERLDPNWFQTRDTYLLRPDAQTFAFFGSATYAFNHRRYSQNAVLWLADRQKKSAGTFVVGASLMAYTMSADSSLVPAALRGEYPGGESLLRSSTVNYTLNFGYVHTFVIRQKFYIHLGLIPGFGVQSRASTLTSQEKISHAVQAASAAEFRVVLGYNGKTYYGGMGVVANAFSDNTEAGGSLEQNFTYLRLFFGRRFSLPFRVPLVDR